MARVLFVFAVEGSQQAPRRPIPPDAIHLGISYISAVLRQHGHETRLLVLKSAAGTDEWPFLHEHVRAASPDVVAFTAVASQFPFIASASEEVRRTRPEAFQVAGGPHPTLNPQEVLEAGFDAVCIGEGESPTLELVEQLQAGRTPGGIENLWIRRGSEIEQNRTRPYQADLDALPFPDRSMWAPWIDTAEPLRHTVLLGRGCPFQCTYCCNHAFKPLAAGPYVRLRSAERIVAELDTLADDVAPWQRVVLEVETIGADPDWAEALCGQLAAFNARRAQPLRFHTNLRVTPRSDPERICRSFAKANVRSVNIGLESGSERVRREVLKRYYSNDDVIRAVRAAQAHGIEVGFYNLVGLPGETFADFLETARVNHICRPDWANTSIFYPYPGTVLHRVCVEQGLIGSAPGPVRERREATLDLPTFPRRRVQRCYDFFDLYVAYAGRPWRRAARVGWARIARRLEAVLWRVPGYWRLRRMVERVRRSPRDGPRRLACN